MKLIFLQSLSGFSGRIVSAIVALTVALVTKVFAALQWPMDEQMVNSISALAGIGASWLLDSLATYLKDKGTVQVQQTLQAADPSLKADGVPGAATQAAAVTAVTTGPNTQ